MLSCDVISDTWGRFQGAPFSALADAVGPLDDVRAVRWRNPGSGHDLRARRHVQDQVPILPSRALQRGDPMSGNGTRPGNTMQTLAVSEEGRKVAASIRIGFAKDGAMICIPALRRGVAGMP